MKWIFYFTVACVSHGVFFVSVSFAQTPTSAQIQGLVIQAEELFRDENQIHLKGNVKIAYKQEYLEADEAFISTKSRKVSLRGNVWLQNTQAKITGDRIDLDYEASTGLIFNGMVESGSIVFEGSLIHKTKESEYFVTEASYTTCSNCPATWSFTGESIRASLGDYAYMKNSVLRFGKMPVLWLPYLVVPLKSDRQSGLLNPRFERSERMGFTFAQSFFWAISRSQDATLTATHYEKSGLKGGLNYRYMLAENSYGELDSSFFNDNVFKNEDRLNLFRRENKSQPFSRWFVKYDHIYDLPNDYVFRTQILKTSDLQYPKDFELETKNNGEPSMENRLSLTKNFEKDHFSIDAAYNVNMLQANPTASNENAVHRTPEIQYSRMKTQIGESGFFYSLHANYLNVTRNGQAWDDLSFEQGERFLTNSLTGSFKGNKGTVCDNSPSCQIVTDGSYDSYRDVLRTGQRLDFRPTLSRPFSLGNTLDFNPSISYRETNYFFNVPQNSQSNRRSVLAEIGVSSTMSRIYQGSEAKNPSRYKHEIQPILNYKSVPYLDHQSHPFFGFSPQTEAPYYTKDSISDNDVNSDLGLQFDYNDRIYDRNLVTMGFVNRLIQKRWKRGTYETRQLASLGIFQSYDAFQESRNDPLKQPWSDIMTVADIRGDYFQTVSTLNYYPYHRITNVSSRLRMINDENQFIQLGIIKKDDVKPGRDVDFKRRVEHYTFSTGFVSRYLNLMGRIVFDANWENQRIPRQIKAWGYIAQFKPPGDCLVINWYHKQSFRGDTTINFEFDFSFESQPKRPFGEEKLSEIE